MKDISCCCFYDPAMCKIVKYFIPWKLCFQNGVSGDIVCEICHSYHDSVEELKAHENSFHPPTKPRERRSKEDKFFACEFCDKRFHSTNYMYAHQKSVHGRESKRIRNHHQGTFPCELCNKKFAQSSTVKRHQREVHGLKFTSKLECQFCHGMYKSLGDLASHMRTKHSSCRFVRKTTSRIN